ncbi:hypothetical protein LTR92_006830 [Exophiala xenobiotica]|nr:hypothetical protein LTR92_006830 [Exophiala xenobiotica]
MYFPERKLLWRYSFIVYPFLVGTTENLNIINPDKVASLCRRPREDKEGRALLQDTPWLEAGFASQVHIRRVSRHKSRRSKTNPFLFRELQASHWYQVNAANDNKAARHNMSETELFDDDRLAKLIRNPRGWLGCSPNATTVSFQDRLKAYENQDAAWEIKIANAKEEAEKQTRQKDDRDPNSCHWSKGPI